MSTWPENPYLAEFLRSPEGQTYMEKYGCLDAWKRRHLLDEIPVVADCAEPQNSFMLVPQRRPNETITELAARSVLVTNVNLEDAWDF